MRPTSNYQLTLAQFTILIDRLDEVTRQKLFFSFTRILRPEQLARYNQEAMDKFRKRNNPSDEDAPVLVEEVSSVGNIAGISNGGKDKSRNEQQSSTNQGRRGTFDDIVPIVDENNYLIAGGNAAYNNAGVSKDIIVHNMDNDENFLEFEPVIVANDDHQAGQGLRAPELDDELKDDYSEKMSNDEELNLTSSKNFFTDKQVKSSRRYLFQENDDEADKEFDNIQEVDHTEEIEQDIMPPLNHSNNNKAAGHAHD